MKNTLIPGLALIIFVSCNKENHQQDEPIIPVVTAPALVQFAVTEARFAQTGKFIKREVTYLTNNPLLKSVRMFSYDGTNRCTEIKIGTIDSSQTNPAFTLKQTLTLSYDGTSILPSSVSSVRSIFPNLVTVYYYKYNSQGFKIKDSVMVKNVSGVPGYRVINYVYDKDDVYTTPVLSGFSYDNVPFDTLSLLTNGNIERLVSKMTNSTGEIKANYTFTYDKYISPYNKLNIANSLYFENSGMGLGYNVPLETHYMGVTTNNMISWSSGTYTVSFRYVYDADKYPLRKEMIMPGASAPDQVTLFEY
jgi:hypothetical protein